MTGNLAEDADFGELAAIGRAVGAPLLREIIVRSVFAGGVGRRREFDRVTFGRKDALRPLDACDAAFSAVLLRGQRVDGLGAANHASPGGGIGVPVPLGVGPAQPSVEAVVPHAEGHVADAGQERLVEVDRAVLHPQRVETVLLAVLGPSRVPDDRPVLNAHARTRGECPACGVRVDLRRGRGNFRFWAARRLGGVAVTIEGAEGTGRRAARRLSVRTWRILKDPVFISQSQIHQSRQETCGSTSRIASVDHGSQP